MRFLVIYAHPVETSFQAAIHRCVVNSLMEAGHEVDDCDLYAEGFQPVLTRQERDVYHNVTENRKLMLNEINRLLKCEGLVFVFPSWWYGMPAILKGYFDRVWLPGVAFEIVNERTKPLLQHIIRFGAVTTYGSPWWLNKFVFRDPNRQVLMRCIRHLISPSAQTLWLAQYGMDYLNDAHRQKFLRKVARRLQAF